MILAGPANLQRVPSPPRLTMRRQTITALVCFFALVLIVAFSGCASAPRDTGVRVWNPLTWFSRAEASASDRAEAKLDAARTAEDAGRDEVLRAAQRAAHEAALALLSAPPSRPVEVASEAADHAAANLDQALGALPADTRAAIRRQIEALLSDNETLRAEGERLRVTQREKDAATSRDLAEATRKTATAEAVSEAARRDLRDAFDRENALANELRNERFQKWAAAALSLAASLAALAYRANAFGLADGIARGLADLRKKQPGVAELATSALDVGLNRAEQTTISRLAQRHLASS